MNNTNVQALFDRAFAAIENNPETQKIPGLRNAIIFAKHNLKWKWNTRRRVQLGVATWEKWLGDVINPWVQLNASLFDKLSLEQQYQTVSHEVAHVIDAYWRGESDHEILWARIHGLMGGDGKRFIDIPGIKVKRNRVQRVRILDTQTGKEYKTTVQQTARALRCNPARFQEIGRFILGDEPLTDH